MQNGGLPRGLTVEISQGFSRHKGKKNLWGYSVSTEKQICTVTDGVLSLPGHLWDTLFSLHPQAQLSLSVDGDQVCSAGKENNG